MVARLSAAGCLAAREEAIELVRAAPDEDVLEAWVRRREQGEPLAWITGTIGFCGLAIHVERGVYVPRGQTEELAQRAAALLPPGGAAVDLCTGSGAVAACLSAAHSDATVVGIDLDPVAAACARSNGVPAVVGDLEGPLRRQVFDVVTAVAPYVPTDDLRLLPADVARYEPRLALDGGGDGLDIVRRIVAAAARILRPGGWLLVEVGGDQDDGLGPSLDAAGFGDTVAWFDDDGDLRGLAAQLGGSRAGHQAGTRS